MSLATLYGPNGQTQVVTVGSTQASQLQSQGWGLTPGSYQTPGGGSQATLYGPSGQTQIVPVGSSQASQLQSQGWGLTPGSYTVPGSLNQNQLQGGGQVSTTPPPSNYNPESYMAQWNSYMQQTQEQYQQQQQQQQQFLQQQNEHRNNLTELMRQLGLKGTDYRNELEKYNLTANTNQLMDIMKQIASTNAGFEKLSIDNQGRAVMTSMIGGQESLIRRQQAAEVGALTSVAQALQGNIALAYDTAEKTINMKYEPIENAIKMELQQLDFISQDLNRADQLTAQARSDMLNAQLQRLQDLKEQDTQRQNIALELAKNGASQNAINAVLQAKSLNDAIRLAGPSYADTAMEKSGYQYVNTPALRDQLKKQGYEIVERGGRTYAKPPEVKKGGGGSGGSGSITGIPKAQANLIKQGLLSQVGSDGYVSPDDYALAKSDWIQAGGSGAEFDRTFKDRVNPNNPYYQTEGYVNPNDEQTISQYKDQGYSKQELIDAGFNKQAVEKVFGNTQGTGIFNKISNWWTNLWK